MRTGLALGLVTAAALALASKSIVMGLPLALLILDVYPLKRLGPRFRDWCEPAQAWPVWREKIPFTALAAATAATAYLVQRTTGYLTRRPGRPDGMVSYNVWFHVWKTVVPLAWAPSTSCRRG